MNIDYSILLKALEVEIKEIKDGGILKISPVVKLKDIDNFEDYSDPLKFSQIFCNFFKAIPGCNPISISFYQGIDICKIAFDNEPSSKEREIFRELISLDGTSNTSGLLIFHNFFYRVIRISCYLSREDKKEKILKFKKEFEEIEDKKMKDQEVIDHGSEVRYKKAEEELLEFEIKYKKYLDYFNY